jgi:short-subunit dehydrogenase
MGGGDWRFFWHRLGVCEGARAPGYSVLAITRRRDRLVALAQEAAGRSQKIEPFVADFATESGLASVVRPAKDLGEIALLVNNAGAATGGDSLSSSLKNEIGAIRLSVEALTTTLTHAVLPCMFDRKRGAVTNLASVVAFQPFPHFAVYSATKAFVVSPSAGAEGNRREGARALPRAVRTEIDVFAHNEGLLGKLPSVSADEVVTAGLAALEDGQAGRQGRWIAQSVLALHEPTHAWRNLRLVDERRRQATSRAAGRQHQDLAGKRAARSWALNSPQ